MQSPALLMIIRQSTGSKQTIKHPFLISFSALLQMRCELGTDTNRTPKGHMSLDKAGHRSFLFCQASHERDAQKGKKKKTYFTLRNAVKLQMSTIYKKVFVIPFSTCLNSIQSLSLTYTMFCCELCTVLCNIKQTFPSLSSVFENHLFNYNALGELHTILNEDIFHSSLNSPSVCNFPELTLRLFLIR